MGERGGGMGEGGERGEEIWYVGIVWEGVERYCGVMFCFVCWSLLTLFAFGCFSRPMPKKKKVFCIIINLGTSLHSFYCCCLLMPLLLL